MLVFRRQEPHRDQKERASRRVPGARVSSAQIAFLTIQSNQIIVQAYQSNLVYKKVFSLNTVVFLILRTRVRPIVDVNREIRHVNI